MKAMHNRILSWAVLLQSLAIALLLIAFFYRFQDSPSDIVLSVEDAKNEIGYELRQLNTAFLAREPRLERIERRLNAIEECVVKQ